MENKSFTFDQLPEAVHKLDGKVDQLINLFNAFSGQKAQSVDQWLSVDELSDYLPGNPSAATLYGRVQRQEIPHKRMGKRLVFLRSEIDSWLLKQTGQKVCRPFKTNQRKGGRQAA